MGKQRSEFLSKMAMMSGFTVRGKKAEGLVLLQKILEQGMVQMLLVVGTPSVCSYPNGGSETRL